MNSVAAMDQGMRRIWLTAIGVFGVFALLMFFTSPTAGDFAWSDAPRHALNGIFVRDFIAAMPWKDPQRFAENYYLHYPALSILLYPPLFSLVLAASYTVFGFSHAVAQATVAFMHFLLGLSAFALFRRWLEPSYAIAAALLLAGAPEVAYWGRQVMLDIPCYAILTASTWCYIKFLDVGRTRHLFLAALLYVAALYTKQTPLFAVVAFGTGLIAARGPKALFEKRVIGAAALAALLLIPLLVMQLKFGQANVVSVLKGGRPGASWLSIEQFTYYLMQLPRQLGWPVMILAGFFLVGVTIRPHWRLASIHSKFLLSWFAAGYLWYSLITEHEPRHDLMALLPLPLAAVLAIRQIAGAQFAMAGSGVALALATGVALWSAFWHTVPHVSGYAEAARFVVDHAPKNGVVLFSGQREGSFVFNVRAANRRDLSVARADKFLFRYAMRRAQGIEDRGLSSERIEQLVKRHGIRYVVFAPDFWADLPSMTALTSLLTDVGKFRVVDRITTKANFAQSDRTLVIYEYLGQLDPIPKPYDIELLVIGRSIDGSPQTQN